MYTKATSLPILYIRSIIPGDMRIPSPAVLALSGRGFRGSVLFLFPMVVWGFPSARA
jgi:hypothetical protein